MQLSLDVVGAVTLVPEVQHRAPRLVAVHVGVLAVIGIAEHAAEARRRPGELVPKARVEGDVGIVRVHVQTRVFVGAVLHNEGLVVVKP